jgi:hypothetical protein
MTIQPWRPLLLLLMMMVVVMASMVMTLTVMAVVIAIIDTAATPTAAIASTATAAAVTGTITPVSRSSTSTSLISAIHRQLVIGHDVRRAQRVAPVIELRHQCLGEPTFRRRADDPSDQITSDAQEMLAAHIPTASFAQLRGHRG